MPDLLAADLMQLQLTTQHNNTLAYTRTHTHTYTHIRTYVLVLVLTTARTGYMDPIQGVSPSRK